MSFTSHKYGDDVLAAAADYVSLDGPLDEFGSVQESVGWNGLVQVSYNDLPIETYEDTKEDFLEQYGDDPAGYLVWIREDDQGFVEVVEFGNDLGLRSGTDAVNRAFNEARDNYNESESDEEYEFGEVDF